LLAEAPTPAVAERVANLFSVCPYAHFSAAFGPQVMVVFYLPSGREWWVEGIANDPGGTLGLARAAVYVSDRPAYPRRRELRVPATPSSSALCGS